MSHGFHLTIRPEPDKKRVASKKESDFGKTIWMIYDEFFPERCRNQGEGYRTHWNTLWFQIRYTKPAQI
jgi:hypothetical protein